jgi:hypothetical protein
MAVGCNRDRTLLQLGVRSFIPNSETHRNLFKAIWYRQQHLPFVCSAFCDDGDETSYSGGGRFLSQLYVALGGLVVSVLAAGPKVRGFKPGRGRWILRVIKSVARLPSEGK